MLNIYAFKKRQQTHNRVTCVNPYVSKPSVNTQPNFSFILSQECNPNQSVWNFLVSTSEVICLLYTFCSLKKGCLKQYTVSSLPFLPIKPSLLHSSTTTAWYMNCWIKHFTSSNLLSWTLLVNISLHGWSRYSERRGKDGKSTIWQGRICWHGHYW